MHTAVQSRISSHQAAALDILLKSNLIHWFEKRVRKIADLLWTRAKRWFWGSILMPPFPASATPGSWRQMAEQITAARNCGDRQVRITCRPICL